MDYESLGVRKKKVRKKKGTGIGTRCSVCEWLGLG